VTAERELGELGLREAIDRLQGRISDPSLGEPIVSLAEVLEWIYTLEEFHKKRIPAYYYDRLQSVDGQTEAALVYARGLFTHSLQAAAHLVSRPTRMIRIGGGGRRGGGVTIGSGGGSAIEWKAFHDLPLPGKPESHGRDLLYTQHVELRTLLQPLQSAITFILAIP
jgi:hypothetical protein